MNWVCSTLLFCLSFNPIMDYTNNDEFINDVIACTVHHNSLYSEEERVPINLVLAQAIHESDWGKSRFAREGNNLFGIRALEGEDFIRAKSGRKVKSYLTWCESVNDYMELLLTSYHYENSRKTQL